MNKRILVFLKKMFILVVNSLEILWLITQLTFSTDQISATKPHILRKMLQFAVEHTTSFKPLVSETTVHTYNIYTPLCGYKISQRFSVMTVGEMGREGGCFIFFNVVVIAFSVNTEGPQLSSTISIVVCSFFLKKLSTPPSGNDHNIRTHIHTCDELCIT